VIDLSLDSERRYVCALMDDRDLPKEEAEQRSESLRDEY
jgi:hypothetical protein